MYSVGQHGIDTPDGRRGYDLPAMLLWVCHYNPASPRSVVRLWLRILRAKEALRGPRYAYVAISRFRPRAGCHLHGVLRQSDSLPVGADRDDEHWERGYDSLSSNDSEYEGHRYVPGALNASDSDSESEYECFDTGTTPLNTFDPSVEPARYSSAVEIDWAF